MIEWFNKEGIFALFLLNFPLITNRYKTKVAFILDLIKYPFRKLFGAVKKKLGWLTTPVIVPYLGYGHTTQLYFKGRVIEDSGLAQPEGDDSIWENMLAMLKRFASAGIPEVKIKAFYNGQTHAAITNENGFFEFNIARPPQSEATEQWEKVPLELEMEYKNQQIHQHAVAEILIAEGSQYGVISDIDDTILISHSTDIAKKLRLMLLKNAVTRLPFEGVKSFYRALSKGTSDTQICNPIFYVSSSEWNLYDLLATFCQHQNIPRGPFLLREVRINFTRMWKSGGGNHGHKIEKIRHILSFHPDKEFILIGDSGQQDAELYGQIALECEGRIKSIYIRDVRNSRHNAVDEIARTLAERGVEMMLVKDTEEAALHAAKKGYIAMEELPMIADDKYADQHAKSDFELVEAMMEKDKK